MQFDTLTFLLFFTIVLFVYWSLTRWSARKNLLLVASYIFYAAWNPFYVGLILLSTLVDWWVVGRLLATTGLLKRRALLWLSLTVNLGLLGYFKYTNFLLDTFRDVLSTMELDYRVPTYDIVLPVGISFYTFQTLSYTIDIYRGKLDRHYPLRDFALFVSFFPQLVAGPIVRAAHFLPQTDTPRPLSADKFGLGAALVITGLFMKVVLADAFLAPASDMLFLLSAKVGALGAWYAAFSFGGQIFFDFAGYSTIAIGAAFMLGFDIPENFRKPYAAIGFSDFWQRWHISLSSWFRDYLYIPLGGNRHGTIHIYRNLMLTMTIAGMWHGASWMFLIWSAIHGLLLATERRIGLISLAKTSRLTMFMYGAFTLVAVNFAWLFFRAPNANVVVNLLQAIAGPLGEIPAVPGILPVTAILIGTWLYQALTRNTSFPEMLDRMRPVPRGIMLGSMMMLIFVYSGGDERSFIYFQF